MLFVLNAKQLGSEQVHYLQSLLSWGRENGVQFAVHKPVYEWLSSFLDNLNEILSFENSEDYPVNAALAISIGGDGTLLETAALVKDKQTPIFCVNAGRLGFLSTSQISDLIENVAYIHQNISKLTIEPRSVLKIEVHNEQQKEKKVLYGLNELSILKTESSSMITVKAFLNEQHLCDYWGDGLILATPTGSTGYSVSCGGPIIMPNARNFVLTAISPHNLTMRPLVLSDDSKFKFQIESRSNNYLISVDANQEIVHSDTILFAEKAFFQINLVQLPSMSFIKTLKDKLNWGLDKRN